MCFFFVIWRLFDFLIAFITPRFIPYLGFFPYRGVLNQYRLPDFLTNLASFDGVHYTQIADNGYAVHEQAFFPFYPLFIKAVTFITHNRLVSGLLISNIFFALGFVLFKKYLHILTLKDNKIMWVLSFLLLFPTSFFFGAVYTEGLFFFLVVSSFYFLKKKNYLLAGFVAALSSATRLMGVFLIIPFILSQILNVKNPNFALRVKKLRWAGQILFVVSPLIGFICYSIYLWKTTGDPLYFFSAQPSFGANRSTHLVFLPQVYFRYLKIFVTAAWNFQYFTSLVEFVFFTFIFIVLILDLLKTVKFVEGWKLKIENLDRLALNLFSMINLVLPTLTGTFSSIPRYALLSLSLFLYLGEMKNKFVRISVAVLFAFLHVVLLGFFIQGYFVG
ncbi:hypothetical protein A2334_06080 [Candidatus Roizmanbacteria bacterium RIFOXYB2_FULL_38_10]|uniref:Glycosyltransferase RgtA/B/C/D-like domain-containing protein n=1 Tax=Candidatus Roizmanbacteria bacterium RIFOXYD1_FULL_38_12 TaxID=1802093 RepID=A0A1F7L257_9BACT|nr:MAG: hypothetical protein A3K47_05080 [Candidatus Roizmanbacteria bacterium RIFOXYA2_FULL_38_14]OGK64121.1 MAG: hypothetical protein A3K27_05080 [Candidatus Roizmanbacteria bacterium RIFOXYA1_FULL_37_12]OGK65967.1 MAG: hypothetical protein A3K38_05080 [Candidatus Roizmanbacteria bacterium RIFOXYB1_FULL_40_23]OGK68414.1 MAG: hypothetical protein A2334_06080 [Candidatus Roizmanbacteria bacterium RIFOXYB2_FULL_38_10]OGK70372.1 MAG: hypothetical protein A3K21_05085 [Candidatus Roizmanbacteria ba